MYNARSRKKNWVKHHRIATMFLNSFSLITVRDLFLNQITIIYTLLNVDCYTSGSWVGLLY